MFDRVVTSYPDPDTDGVACAMALAALLGEGWRPVLLGRISGETEYALSQSGLERPALADRIAGEEIALVDTHHLAQLPLDFPVERVTLIVDHHPKGDEAAFPNARVINEKVGAAATLVALRWLERPAPDLRLLKLLGFAVLSNTLNFSAPSTVPLDREVYDRIVQHAPITEEVVAGMFARRADALAGGLEKAFQADLKLFDSEAYGQVGVAQLEIYGLLERIDPEKAEWALDRVAQVRGLPRLLFNGVDIRAGKSLVVCANEESRRLAEGVLSLSFPARHRMVDRVLLRKTDFIL